MQAGRGQKLTGELRIDPLSGREVIIAPGRAKRPGARRASEKGSASDSPEPECPFCEGREAMTPPELFAFGAPEERAADSPGWKVRVVPNLYPAFERQQVVVHSPAHVRSIAELDDEQLALIAEAWVRVAAEAQAEGVPHLFALINEGRVAGASLPHAHSQLVWLREAPPQVRLEQERLQAGACGLCEVLASSGALEIEELGGVVALAAPAGRGPYEVLIAPKEHRPDGLASTAELAPALQLAARMVRRLHAVEGPTALNLWLHSFGGDGHWHIELLPRLGALAGVELGAGIYVNALAPEEAAKRLRDG